MNDTQQSPPTTGPDDGFDPQRLRTIADMRRSSDDRIIGGVCAGAAKYLNIDPVIVRVVLAVLTVAGFAGLILYAAAWFLLPAEGEDKSIAADWFKLDKNEEQVRVAGLVIAAALAALSIVGDNGWAWWGGAPWWLLPVGLVYYVFAVRPRRRREARERQAYLAADPAAATSPTAVPPVTPAHRRSPALTFLVVSVIAIALATTRIWSEYHDDVPGTGYIAIALGIVGLGLLVSTFVGNGGPLIAIGALLAIALAIGSVLPSGRVGAQTPTPTTAADVKSHYTHGVGLLELDLTRVADPESLAGRTLHLDAGVGQTKVIVPEGLRAVVEADLRAGEISLFGRTDDGTDVSMREGAGPAGSAVTIDIEQRLGNVEVISR
jgi:phage shock protein PspC (stress-responsive transcriptional regulator)